MGLLCAVGRKANGVKRTVTQFMPLRTWHIDLISRRLFRNDSGGTQTAERVDHLCLHLRFRAPEIPPICARDVRHDGHPEQPRPAYVEQPANPRYPVAGHYSQSSQILRHLPLVMGLSLQDYAQVSES